MKGNIEISIEIPSDIHIYSPTLQAKESKDLKELKENNLKSNNRLSISTPRSRKHVTFTNTNINLNTINHSPSVHIDVEPFLQRKIIRIRTYLTIVSLLLLTGLFAFITYDIINKSIYNNQLYFIAFIALIPCGYMFFAFGCTSVVCNVYMAFANINWLYTNSQYYSAEKQNIPHRNILAMRTPRATNYLISSQDSTSIKGASNSIVIPNIPNYIESKSQTHSVNNTPRANANVTKRQGSIESSFVARLASLQLPQTPVGGIDKDILPPIIIQIPVYKESLENVIKYTCKYVDAALKAYQDIGGYCKVIICDDGLQCISEDDREKRAAFYRQCGYTYVGRPPHNRPGIFKKASNLNYTYNISETGIIPDDAILYGDFHIPRNALILLLDSDTVVPENCICDTVGEFILDPELPYTQHYTTPFDIKPEDDNNTWLHMISHFTEKIYFMGIACSTALGGVCPLVGHNAFIRYSDLKRVGFWSENCVSEDFDLFIKLANEGKFGRFVMYTGPEFKEGVSLSFDDEVIKYKRFAYGTCEICFNPFKKWLTKGPFSPTFWRFLGCQLSIIEKLNVVFYLCTYFAMSSAFYFCVSESFAIVFYPKLYSSYLSTGFNTMISCLVIFGLIATVSQIVFDIKYLVKEERLVKKDWRILIHEVKWIFLITLFFSSVLFHTTESTFRYFFSLPMSLTATVKDKDEKRMVYKLLKVPLNYWFMYVLLLCILGPYIYVYVTFIGNNFYYSWSIFYYITAHLTAPFIFTLIS